MKLIEVLIETDEWENAGYSNKKSEIAFLEAKRKAITHQRKLLMIKLMALAQKDIITTENNPTWTSKATGTKFVAIPGTGTKETGFQKYYSDPNQPEVIRFVSDMKRLEEADKKYMMRIKDLTVKGHTFVFTGFRDSDMERRIETLGGRVTTSVSGKTDYVVAANPADITGKVLKAKQLGVRILSKGELSDILRD